MDVDALRLAVAEFLDKAGRLDERGWMGRASRRDLWTEVLYRGLEYTLTGKVGHVLSRDWP